MNITKVLAEEVANKMVEPLEKKINLLHDEQVRITEEVIRKSIPLEIEEAAMIDGCTPLRTFFSVVLPIMKPTYISVGILETMWIWNDFLLPYLVLDLNKYKTISIAIQYMKGSYGRVDMGAVMAALILAVIPVVIFYLACQKHIIKGVAAGAVKG